MLGAMESVGVAFASQGGFAFVMRDVEKISENPHREVSGSTHA